MSTAAHVRAVQDIALDRGLGAADAAVYAGLINSIQHLFGEPDAEVDGFPDDSVMQAALAEVPAETRGVMASWLVEYWTWISNSADLLDSLGFLDDDEFPVIPAGALAYRRAAEDLALEAGESCAAVSWAGAVAAARWLRLYGDREVELTELETRDAVLTAARRGLPDAELRRVTAWVQGVWETVDDMASERAS